MLYAKYGSFCISICIILVLLTVSEVLSRLSELSSTVRRGSSCSLGPYGYDNLPKLTLLPPNDNYYDRRVVL